MLTDRLKNCIEIMYSFKVSEQLLALKPGKSFRSDSREGFREKWNIKIKPVPKNRSNVKTRPWGIKARIPEHHLVLPAVRGPISPTVASPTRSVCRRWGCWWGGRGRGRGWRRSVWKQSWLCADRSTSCLDNQLLGRVFTDLKVCVS